MTSREQVAVVGSGLSGLTAAFLLRKVHDVTLYEASDRFGGSLDTHRLTDSGGGLRAIDSGLAAVPTRAFPVLMKLVDELDLVTVPTEVTVSVTCRGCGLEYGAAGPRPAVYAQGRRLFSPAFRRLHRETERFREAAHGFTRSMEERPGLTYGAFLAEHGFGDDLVHHHAAPLVANAPGVDPAAVLDAPAAVAIGHLDRHGLLTDGTTSLVTLEGGAATIAEAVTALLRETLVRTAVTRIERTGDGVLVSDVHGSTHRYDAVVVATPADVALTLLADPSALETELLGTFRYREMRTIVHGDRTAMPTTDRAWATWNHRTETCGSPVATTTWANRLHGFDSPDDVLVTSADTGERNPLHAVRTGSRLVLDEAALVAQRRMGDIATRTTVFAGAHHGLGTAEDACRAGAAAAAHLGA